jgi:bacterioferritin (cytochrome b1)
MADTGTDTLNELLRGELSAVETYMQAINALEGTTAARLTQIKDEHVESANALREQIRALGSQPDQSSGLWGAFAKAVEGTAAMISESTAVSALRKGEQTGVESYEKSLSKTMPRASMDLIESQLIPRTRRHIHILEGILAAEPRN